MNYYFLPCKQSLGPVNCGWIIAHLAGGHPASFHSIMLKRPGTKPNKPSPFPFPSAGTSSSYDAKVNSCCEYCFHIPLALSHARMIPFLREISVCSETMAGIGGRNQSTRGLQSIQGILPGWILPRFLLQTWRNLKSKAENGRRSEDKMIQGKNLCPSLEILENKTPDIRSVWWVKAHRHWLTVPSRMRERVKKKVRKCTGWDKDSLIVKQKRCTQAQQRKEFTPCCPGEQGTSMKWLLRSTDVHSKKQNSGKQALTHLWVPLCVYQQTAACKEQQMPHLELILWGKFGH